jgi:L-malate glycosyltransferase
MKTDIVFVTHALGLGGAEYIVRNLALEAAKTNSVALVLLDAAGELAEELQASGIQVLHVNRNPGWQLENFQNFFSALNSLGPRVVHAHQYTPFMYSALYKLLFNRKMRLIFTEHGRHFPDVVSAKRKFANQLLGRLANRVTAVCLFAARALKQNEGIRGEAEIIYNGIVPSALAGVDLRQQFSIPPERKLILYIGSFRPVKNPQLLLLAMAQVLAHQQNAHLVLIGDGSLKSELAALAASLKIEPHVTFAGALPDAAQYLRGADIFVQPSLSEAHSLAMLEAMAASIPIVATNVGGVGESLQHEQNALLVPSNEPQEMAAAILKLINRPELAAKLAQQAKEDFEQRFTYEKMLGAYLEIYKDELFKAES